MITCEVIINLNFRTRGEQPVQIGTCNFVAVPRLGELIEVNYKGSLIIAHVTKVLHHCGDGQSPGLTLYADRLRLTFDDLPL